VGALVVAAALLFLALGGASSSAPGPSVGTWMTGAGVEPRFVSVEGSRLRYVRRGSGPPVVLLHGLASSIYTWKDVLPVLAVAHDVIAIDMPGFGGSEVPASVDGPSMARSVLGALDALGVARASFVGNSLGGAFSVAIAASQPSRVDRLVLIDAAGYNFDPRDRPWVLRVAGGAPGRIADSLPLRPMVRLSLRQVFHDDSMVTPDRVDEYVAPLLRPGARAPVRRVLAAGGGRGFPGIIRSVRAPTLVIWGRYDEWIPLRDASRFASDIPGARVVVVEAGHMPQEERPAETAKLIAEFLAAR
jgi:pimeloyl-ACP methyl ester carboxylesterase